jgi:hypothetical protein
MTEKEIKTAIKNMNASDEVKKELQKQCDNKDQGARFYIYSLIKQRR